MGIDSVLALMGNRQQAAADAGQAAYRAAVARNQAEIAQRNADLARQQGEADAQRSQLRTARLEGSQRALLAAQGGDVDSGSPLDVVADTARAGATDAATLRSNAALRAYNYTLDAGADEAAANDADLEGENAMARLPLAQGASLLGGLGRAARL